MVMQHKPAPERLEDETLVGRVQTGDAGAFESLVLRYQDRVYNVCYRFVGHAEDARDLTQEAFLKAYRSIHRFQRESGFYTWLFRIAMNAALTHRKKARLRLAGSLDANEADTIPAPPDRSPPTDADASVNHQRVANALAKLEADHRAVIVLRDIEGFDYEQIANILEIQRGTVKSRIHRARAAFREVWDRKELSNSTAHTGPRP